MILPKSCKIEVSKYAGAANGINWQILSVFLNLNSQLDRVQPFIIPNNPPKILVKKSTVIEPITSFLPVTEIEKFPLNIVFKPSFKKLTIGRKIRIAISKAIISNAFKSFILLKVFRYKILYFNLFIKRVRSAKI